MHMPAVVPQDNCRPHIEPNNQSIIQARLSSGSSLNIQVKWDPANSPDFKVSYSGFFHSIQILQSKIMARSIEGLVKSVEHAFQE